MMSLEPQAATAVIGLAAFQLYDVWNKNAPSIQECREAVPGCDTTRQKLMDAEITVGTLAVTIGVIFAVLTKDLTALIIMISIFAALIFLHHWILASAPVN